MVRMMRNRPEVKYCCLYRDGIRCRARLAGTPLQDFRSTCAQIADFLATLDLQTPHSLHSFCWSGSHLYIIT